MNPEQDHADCPLTASTATDLGREFLGELSLDNLRYVSEDAERRGITPSSHLNMIVTAFRTIQERRLS